MKRQFVLLFSLVSGNFLELLQFVQRTRPFFCKHEIADYEYHELVIPHPEVRKVMDELYADYMKRNEFSLLEFMDRMVEASLGSLLPVCFISKPKEYEPRELMAFFNGNKPAQFQYSFCMKNQFRGLSPLNCLNQLINNELKGVHRQHAKYSTYFLDIAKRIAQSNRLPALSPAFRVHSEENYLEDLNKHLCNIVPRIVDDRKTMIPEVVYVLSMFRYIYHQALFLGKMDLSRAVFEAMKCLYDAGNQFSFSFFKEEPLPNPHAIKVEDRLVHVDMIVALGVSQRQGVENDVTRVFIKDGKMFVSFPDYFKNVVSSIIAKAKEFLQSNSSLSDNPTSITCIKRE